MKKALAVTLVSLLSASALLAGCSSSTNTATDTSKPSTTAAATEAAKPKEKVTLKVEVFDRGNSPSGVTVSTNFFAKWIQDKFGTPNNIDVQLTPVQRSEEITKLNVLMSTGDAPDIVFTYDAGVVFNYVKSGGLTDLSAALKSDGPNLSKYLGADLLKYGQFDGGKQYAIPAKRVIRGIHSSIIRKDWLDKVGLPEPKSIDELVTVLKAFKEKDPGGTGGKVIPMGLSIGSNGPSSTYEQFLYAFLKPATDEQFSTQSQKLEGHDVPILMAGFKDGVKKLNELYNAGLVSPDFGLDKDKKKLQADIANGLVGFSTLDINEPFQVTTPNILNTLQKTNPSASLLPIEPYKNSEGKYIKPLYDPTGLFVMVPKNSKHATEAIKYLDWMSKQDVLFPLVNGIEGQHFNMKDGFPQKITTDEAKATFYNNVDMAIVVNGNDFGDISKSIEANALTANPAAKDLIVKSTNIALHDGFAQSHFTRPIESEGKFGAALADKYRELLAKSIMAKAADFDKTYDEALSQYLKAGGQQVADERKAAYAEGKK